MVQAIESLSDQQVRDHLLVLFFDNHEKRPDHKIRLTGHHELVRHHKKSFYLTFRDIGRQDNSLYYINYCFWHYQPTWALQNL